MALVTEYKNLPTIIKNQIRANGHNICSMCLKKVDKVHVHHIDHNPYNNDSDNLQLVCKYCHPKIHTERPNKALRLKTDQRGKALEDLLTPQQVADKLKVHHNTVYRYINEGKLKCTSVGNMLIRIKESDLDEFINMPKK